MANSKTVKRIVREFKEANPELTYTECLNHLRVIGRLPRCGAHEFVSSNIFTGEAKGSRICIGPPNHKGSHQYHGGYVEIP